MVLRSESAHPSFRTSSTANELLLKPGRKSVNHLMRPNHHHHSNTRTALNANLFSRSKTAVMFNFSNRPYSSISYSAVNKSSKFNYWCEL